MLFELHPLPKVAAETAAAQESNFAIGSWGTGLVTGSLSGFLTYKVGKVMLITVASQGDHEDQLSQGQLQTGTNATAPPCPVSLLPTITTSRPAVHVSSRVSDSQLLFPSQGCSAVALPL